MITGGGSGIGAAVAPEAAAAESGAPEDRDEVCLTAVKQCGEALRFASPRLQDSIELRDTDCWIATYPKCGTTWVSAIAHFLRGGDEDDFGARRRQRELEQRVDVVRLARDEEREVVRVVRVLDQVERPGVFVEEALVPLAHTLLGCGKFLRSCSPWFVLALSLIHIYAADE